MIIIYDEEFGRVHFDRAASDREAVVLECVCFLFAVWGQGARKGQRPTRCDWNIPADGGQHGGVASENKM